MSDHPWDDTRLEALGDGRYRAVVSDRWVLALACQGGLLAALAARAGTAELGPDQPLRSIHGVFARPVAAGPVEISVEIVRRGRSMSQVRASVAPEGGEVGFEALAVFGVARPKGFSFTELTAPEVPDPDGCPSFRDPPPPEAGVDWDGPLPFWRDVLDGRAARGTPPWIDGPEGPAEVVDWFRFEAGDPIGPDGRLDPLALLVMADVMPGAVFQGQPRRTERIFAPSVDLGVQLFGPATPGWILAHARAHHAGDGYASAEMALWDPRAEGGPSLVAWASQQMFFTSMG